MEPVAAVAGLRERVGPEAGELLRRHELVEDVVRRRVLEVVDELAALVADVAEAFEAIEVGHGVSGELWRGRSRAPSTSNGLKGIAVRDTRVGPTPVRARRRCGGWIPPGGPAIGTPWGRPYGLAAAHLQGPTLIMHVWTTSFPWCPIGSTRGGAVGSVWVTPAGRRRPARSPTCRAVPASRSRRSPAGR